MTKDDQKLWVKNSHEVASFVEWREHLSPIGPFLGHQTQRLLALLTTSARSYSSCPKSYKNVFDSLLFIPCFSSCAIHN